MTNLATRLAALGVTRAHLQQCRLPAYPEAILLVDAGLDMFGRLAKMTPDTFTAWQAMQQAAAQDNITLLLVSAFRSVEYQCEVIRGKLEAGREIDEILTSNAIPGHSEHHTGRALDLSCPGIEPLTTEFEETEAFTWLDEHAGDFGFTLSYPRDNPHGIVYEPWHWAFNT